MRWLAVSTPLAWPLLCLLTPFIIVAVCISDTLLQRLSHFLGFVLASVSFRKGQVRKKSQLTCVEQTESLDKYPLGGLRHSQINNSGPDRPQYKSVSLSLQTSEARERRLEMRHHDAEGM
jgi:hypothetical protein